MKRTIIAISIILVMILVGCSKPAANTNTGERLKILTSFYPVHIAAMNITQGVKGVELVNLTKPTTGCLHDYQLTPQDMIILEETDILIVNGAGMESFLDKALASNREIRVITASDGIELIYAHHEHSHGEDDHDHDHDEASQGNSDQGDHHGHGDDDHIDHTEEANPHVWVSITNYLIYVQNISHHLCAMDPANADKYRENTVNYIKKLTAIQARMAKELAGVTNKQIITFHEAFPYFAKEFGLEIAAVIVREPGTEATPEEIIHVIQTVRETGCMALFAEPQYSPAVANTIANETGAKVYFLDPHVNGELHADAYLEAMEKNLRTLLEALQ